MSDFQQKPNTGKAWRTSKEDKTRDHERLKQYSWYNDLEREQKAEKITAWSGNLLVEIAGQEVSLGIGITEEKSRRGVEQLGIRVWENGLGRTKAGRLPKNRWMTTFHFKEVIFGPAHNSICRNRPLRRLLARRQ